REEHASRIARKEIGMRLENIPLKVLTVEVIPEEADAETETEVEADGGNDDARPDDDTAQ
ncbi:MAG: hypothetical protein R3282_08055, partial [Rhodothermales bacterium]|nr:hypothetical protein [Rhodothermales bacterium]